MGKELYSLKELAMKELNKIVEKGTMSPTELENATKAVCLLEKIQKLEMEETDMGYAEGYHHMPEYGSYRRGRSPVTGRYISRGMTPENGMSGHSINDRMAAKLEEMYDEAKTEHERDVLDMWIKRLETER